MEQAGGKNPHDRLIDCVRNGLWGIGFSMKNYFIRSQPCGSVACISGFAGFLLDKTDTEVLEDGVDSLKEFLGVGERDAKLMAYVMSPGKNGGGKSIDIALEDVSAEQAARMLEIHRDTGEVDWESAIAAFPAESATETA